MNSPYSKIWMRMAVAFCLLITVPVAILVLVTTNSLRDAAIDKTEVSLGRLIEHKKDVITLFLEEKEDLLTMLVGMYPISYLGRQENLDKLFIAVNKTGSIVDLHVIDSSGAQVAYVGPYAQSLVGKSYYNAQWFQEVLIKGSHVSDVFLGFRNVPHIVVAVSDPLKTYVLRATINSEQFNNLLLSSQIGPHGDSFIVNREGKLQTPSRAGLTELNDEDRLLLEHHEGTAIVKREESVVVHSDEKATTEHFDATSIVTRGESIVATRWVKDGQWCLFVKALIEDSLGPFYKVRNHVILVIFGTSVVFLAIALLFINYLLQRIEKEDRRRVELGHQMVQMEKMATVGRLAAGIAHEINNPLQMITSQAGWISELLPEEDPEKVKNFEEYKKSVEQIRSHVRRAGAITHRLLGFSRKISAEKQNVKINELVEETISFVEKEAEYNHVSIIRKYAEGLPETMVDGPQLQQVFLNLLNNAIDETEQGGVIEVRTAVEGSKKLLVEFADNGHGIKPENLQRIFDPFFTTKDPGKGTGLGLYISYDIVKKLGGNIKVANRTGGGAIFTITLPILNLSSPR
ncbi:MAG: two-component sensor histidine kinase [Proteobacteria bacterium]|nr:two-component sensor histidine kinase [Pseudomonadota bacterium]